jgi:serine/threonine-protein kinase
MRAHLDQKPTAPIELAPQISPELSSLIERALEKSPEYRFQTAADFSSALKRVFFDVQSRILAGSRTDNSVPASVPSPTMPSPTTGKVFDPALLEMVRKNLAAYIGPMAKVIVNRAAKNARSAQDLYETVAEEIPSPADRQKFLRSLPL